MYPLISPSEIATKALGLSVEGVPLPEDQAGCHCAYCGIQLKSNDIVVTTNISSSFTDNISLADTESPYTCGHCAILLTAKPLVATGSGVFSLEEGFAPFRKWKDIAKNLRNPPAGPFIMTYATAKNQHMAWRAPVNYSPEMFYVRVGLRNLKIRRNYLLEAEEAAQRVAQIFGFEATKKTAPHPFYKFDKEVVELKSQTVGRLRINPYRKNDKKDPLYEDRLKASAVDRNTLENLTLGELWALPFLLTPNAGEEIETEPSE